MISIAEVQVSSRALKHNVSALRSLMAPGQRMVAVVKGNAYGHGLREVATILEPLVDAFQVDDLDELRELRSVTQKRALVFGYVPKAGVEEAIRLGGELAVYDVERLEAIVQAGKGLGARPKVHIKIDALLGRQGVLPRDLPAFLQAVKAHGEIDVVSVYAHYANLEDTTSLEHAQRQERVFQGCFETSRGAFPGIERHFSATSGLMAREVSGSANSLVRVGMGLYGMYPALSFQESHSPIGLQPVMRWVTMLAQVKRLPEGHPVGYGLTYSTPREMNVGIVPQGYADGYDRGLSGSGVVLVRGRRCPVIGRIAMNMFAVDLSSVQEPQPEEEVVLLGKQGEDEITAEEIAARIGTINYEVTTRVSPLLARRIV